MPVMNFPVQPTAATIKVRGKWSSHNRPETNFARPTAPEGAATDVGSGTNSRSAC